MLHTDGSETPGKYRNISSRSSSPVSQNIIPAFFADDTSIFICGNNINAVQANVDTTVKQLLLWFEKNKLLININKTVVMSFQHRQNNVQCQTIKLHDKTISFKNNIKFLGQFKMVNSIPIIGKKVQ